MKKTIFLSLLFALLLGLCSVAASDISVFLNGNPVVSDVAPTIINDRTMLPFRAVCEAMQCTVDWNDTERIATVSRQGFTVKAAPDVFELSCATAETSYSVTLDVAPMIRDGRLLLPLRAFAEVFGAEVLWDGDARKVSVIYHEILPKGNGTANGLVGAMTSVSGQLAYINPVTGTVLTAKEGNAVVLGEGGYLTSDSNNLYYTVAGSGVLLQFGTDALIAENARFPLFADGAMYYIDATSLLLMRSAQGAVAPVLDKQVYYFNIYNDMLYYVSYAEEQLPCLYAAPLSSPSTATAIYASQTMDYPCIADDAVFVKDGTDMMKITLADQKPSVFLPDIEAYTLNYFDGMLYFVNQSDQDRLYRVSTADGSTPEALTEKNAYFPHIIDGKVYFITQENDSLYWSYIFTGQSLDGDTPILLPVEPEKKDYQELTPLYAPEARPTATITVRDFGTITIELHPEAAPQTVTNFVSLAKNGFYDGLIFHRVIQEFMIQGGCPDGNGTGGPGYTILGEFSGNGIDNPLKHTRGAVSMARAQAPNSGGSQFFICDADNEFLDGSYAVFGYVTAGMEVVDAIAATEVAVGSSGEASAPVTPVVIESIVISE